MLSAKGFETFAPLITERRKWSDRVVAVQVPLFSRYIFARFPYTERHNVLCTSGVHSLVSFGSVVSPASDDEIDAVRIMIQPGNRIQHLPSFEPGQNVRIGSGCFAGCVGRIVKIKGADLLVVNVQSLNRAISVEIAEDQVLAA